MTIPEIAKRIWWVLAIMVGIFLLFISAIFIIAFVYGFLSGLGLF